MSENYFAVLPSLVINVTDNCNFHCQYCPPFGENLCKGMELYDEEAVLAVIEMSKSYHLPLVRITGGEPFLVPNRVRLFLEACRDSFGRLLINTNGSLLHDNFEWLELYKKNFVLKISMDSMTPSMFQKISGVNSFYTVYNNLAEAIERRFIVEINCVIFDQDSDDLCNIVDFAIANHIDCKLLTISTFHGTVGPKSRNENISRLLDYLKYLSPVVTEEQLKGSRGGTMLVFPFNGNKIYFFDHSVEKSITPKRTYLSLCKQCKLYPCDSGAISISISTDGVLSVCRGRKDLGANIFLKSKCEIESLFKKQLKYYNNCFSIDVNTRQRV